MKLMTVFFIIFATSCGGAFGIENMISSSGPGMTIVILAVLPFLWANPVGLVCAELGSALPLEGGFYKWVQRAMGEFWGFQAGWWRTLSIYVDSSVYVVLAVGYVATFLHLTPITTWLLAFLIICIFTVVNILGIEMVGLTSVIFSIIVLLPFVAFSVFGLFHMHYNPFNPMTPPGVTYIGSTGLGLAIAMWMYAGYESIGTMAGEIKDSAKLIPKAMVLVLVAMIIAYELPTIVGLACIGQWTQWAVSGGISFVQAAHLVGGAGLGVAMLAAAIASNVTLFSDFLASGTRTPFVMARDNLMPKFFGKIYGKYGTPVISILVMAAIDAVLCINSFNFLIVIDVFLLMFSYIMILLAAIFLRFREPELPRPFKVWGGKAVLTIMCAPAIIIAIIALCTNGTDYIIGGLIGAVSGPVAYFIFKKIYGGIASNPFDPKAVPPSAFEHTHAA
jgi:amino acid transporter